MHLRNQNGRKRLDSGQGSSGEGAFIDVGFGLPGLIGEWMSLSNNCIPPDGIASTIKLAPFGVGIVGIVLAGILHGFVVEDELPVSEFSGTDTVSIFFKLEEEKFFLRVPGPAEPLLVSRAGDSGTEGMLSSLSPVVTGYNDGIGGNVFGVVSAEPGPGRGDDPFRAMDWAAVAFAGEGIERPGKACRDSGMAKADLGGSVRDDVESGASDEGG